MEEIKFIDRVTEQHLIRDVGKKIKENEKFRVDPLDTLLLNVSPDYSSIMSQNLIHDLSTDEPLDMLCVNINYPKENWKGYELKFISEFKDVVGIYRNFIVCEAGIITGQTFTWLTKCMRDDFSIPDENILTVALYQHQDSIYKCNIVGEEYTGDLTFNWEKYNKYFA